METLGYLLGLVSYIYIWDSKLWKRIFMEPEINNGLHLGYKLKRGFYTKINETLLGEMLRCGTCLSGWAGIIIFLCTFNIFFLSLPIMYKVLTK